MPISSSLQRTTWPSTWQWQMDEEEKGHLVPFARVVLRRK